MEGPAWIGDQDVKRLLNFQSLVSKIEKSFVDYSQGKVIQPVRSVVASENGFLGLMPTLSQEDKIMGTKLVTFFPQNKDVPSHHAIITLFDATNGVPIVIMDGEYITAMRTAAASAVATKYLAMENSKTLAILGSGVQARSHYKALSSIRLFDQVRIWSRSYDNARRLAAEIGAEACENVKEAVHDADVIVTVTSSTTPVLMKDWVKEGAHINAVGACRPDQQELDPELVRHSQLYVDSIDGAKKESGDVILSKATIHSEIGEMLLGKVEVSKEKTTIFKSLGMGVQDLVAAKLVWDCHSREKGL